MNGFRTPISSMLFADDQGPIGSVPRPAGGVVPRRLPRGGERTSEDPYYAPTKYGSAKTPDPRYPWGTPGPSMIPSSAPPPAGGAYTGGPAASPMGNINTGSQFNPFALMMNQASGGGFGMMGPGGRPMDPVASLVQQLNAVRMQILRNYIFGGR